MAEKAFIVRYQSDLLQDIKTLSGDGCPNLWGSHSPISHNSRLSLRRRRPCLFTPSTKEILIRDDIASLLPLPPVALNAHEDDTDQNQSLCGEQRPQYQLGLLELLRSGSATSRPTTVGGRNLKMKKSKVVTRTCITRRSQLKVCIEDRRLDFFKERESAAEERKEEDEENEEVFNQSGHSVSPTSPSLGNHQGN